MQITDSMIEKALHNTAWMKGSDTKTIIIIMVAVTIFLGCILFISNNAKRKMAAGGTLALLLVLGIAVIYQDTSMAKAINEGKWEVHTDVVERVMESTDDSGDKDYFMVLQRYGRVSLDSYAEATLYYSGQEVYIVVVRRGNEYENAGILYPTNLYKYVGSHKKQSLD